MNKEKYRKLVKVLLIALLRTNLNINELVVFLSKSKYLLNMCVEQKEDVVPIQKIIEILEIKDNDTEDLYNRIFKMKNKKGKVEKNVEYIMKKYNI